MRKSNIELLRILSMLFVVWVHLDGAALGLPSDIESLNDITARDAWKIIVEAFTIVGVNSFTLISGYFGIRARISGMLKFTFMCMFYSVGIATTAGIISPHPYDWHQWMDSWMVFTHTDLWYVPAYLILYILSPMLNSASEQLSFRQFSFWLGLFVAVNIWCGWMWGANFNPTGYTPVQLIMMYLIGQWLKRLLPIVKCKPLIIRYVSAVSYILLSLLTALCAIWLEPSKAYAYNSPWVILSSVALFTFFATIVLSSRSVNTLAAGAFATYLIHKNPAIWGGIIKPLAIRQWEADTVAEYTLFCLLFGASVYLCSSLADSIRRFLFRKAETLINDKVKIDT